MTVKGEKYFTAIDVEVGLKCQKALYFNYQSKNDRDLLYRRERISFQRRIDNFSRHLAIRGFIRSMGLTATEGFSVPPIQALVGHNKPRLWVAKGVNCGGRGILTIDCLILEKGEWYSYSVPGIEKPKNVHYESYLDKTEYGLANLKTYLTITKHFLVWLKPEYDLQAPLFECENITERVEFHLESRVPIYVSAFTNVFALSKPPSIEFGSHCRLETREPCRFIDNCIPDRNTDNILSYKQIKSETKYLLAKRNLFGIADIPVTLALSKKESLIVECAQTKELVLESKKITSWLGEVGLLSAGQLPSLVAFLDFEAYDFATPHVSACKPREYVCFQYSLHLYDSSKHQMLHREKLFISDENPNRLFLRCLLRDLRHFLVRQGKIIVYNATFERSRLEELSKQFPEYAPSIDKVLSCFVDLMIPFQKMYYYHPIQQGSYSLKRVYASIISESENKISYENLKIREGLMAVRAYQTLLRLRLRRLQRQRRDAISLNLEFRLRQALLDYCGLDTASMVTIFNYLLETVNSDKALPESP
jgi:hypothetical protein